MVKNTASSATHRMVQKSATLSRKYVKKPSVTSGAVAVKINAPKKKIAIQTDDEPVAKITKKPASENLAQIKAAARAEAAELISKRIEEKPVAKIVAKKPAPISAAKPVAKAAAPVAAPASAAKPVAKSAPKLSRFMKRSMTEQKTQAKSAAKARQAKDRAIRKALKTASTVSDAPLFRPKHTGRKVLLAVSCSALVVAGLAVFVKVNMPDISVRVAAFQSGVEATYPSYVPRGYTLDGVTSEKEGAVVINFINQSTDSSFSLTEETSAWDSNALLTNYVKHEFASNYTTLREQGITIYVDSGNAAWVNGGILYKLSCTGTNLTKEQIRNIAVSL